MQYIVPQSFLLQLVALVKTTNNMTGVTLTINKQRNKRPILSHAHTTKSHPVKNRHWEWNKKKFEK